MSGDRRVQELMAQWREHRRQGRNVPAEELCRDSPHLLEPFKRELEALPTDSGAPTPTVFPVSPAPQTPLPPEVDGHVILARLGHGGIGVVYRARDPKLVRDVALKMLRAGSWADDLERERFRREIAAMAQLRHPHIVPIFSQGEHQGQPYFTMSLIEGGNLKDHLPRFQADPRRAVELMVKVARAVHYLHEHNLLHRDLKPPNILLDEDGEPYVSDFGLAKFLDPGLEMTQTGQVMGTRPYMAPEQAVGRIRQLGAATDVWALGVILYELLAGCRPFKGDDDEEVRTQILSADPPTLTSSRPELSRALEAVVLKCLEKEPARRLASAGELADELQRWLDTGTARTRPTPWYRRAAHWVRKHPLALGMTMAGALVLFLLWFKPAAPDPELPVRQWRADLARGQAVQLLGPNRPLRWHRWQVGPAAFLPAGADRNALRFQAFGFSLLELLPEVPLRSYELTASVRHEVSDLGSVGIFLGLTRYPAAKGSVRFFVALGLDDLEMIKSKKGLPPKLNPLGFHLYRFREPDEALGIPLLPMHGKGAGAPGRFKPSMQPHGAAPWRRLTVRVTPDGLSASLDNTTRTELSRKDFFENRRELLPAEEAIQALDVFPPPGGVGLLLVGGQGAFKDFSVRPLSE
jgi:serine/threonine-protein kinase